MLSSKLFGDLHPSLNKRGLRQDPNNLQLTVHTPYSEELKWNQAEIKGALKEDPLTIGGGEERRMRERRQEDWLISRSCCHSLLACSKSDSLHTLTSSSTEFTLSSVTKEQWFQKSPSPLWKMTPWEQSVENWIHLRISFESRNSFFLIELWPQSLIYIKIIATTAIWWSRNYMTLRRAFNLKRQIKRRQGATPSQGEREGERRGGEKRE